jgi:4-hydroxy-3-polyprenylbenzoate decarboxylase
MPQQSLPDFVKALESAGFLLRIKEEKTVDELPQLMEDNPLKAILVEKIKDCKFQFLANAYSNQEMIGWGLGCTKNETGALMAKLSTGRYPPKIVTQAACKEVIIKGDQVDLTEFPLFLHHDRDGHAYTNDNLVISKDPETNVTDWGIYRSMFRTKNEKSFDMTCSSHRQRLNALKAQKMGKNLPMAVVIGGPIYDKLAALTSVPNDVDDWEVLGGIYGEPAEIIKCETIDLYVPANAEIVLEGELIATDGWIYDEGPYGEFTGMYGGGLKQNPIFKVNCITHRKNAIFQHATIGGSHPWYTDNMLQLPAVETDIFYALQKAGIDVKEVRAPAGGLSNIAYAKIKTVGGGDGMQALAIMLSCSRLTLPKIAMVFDEDVDIWDDQAILWAMAFRYMPHRDTLVIPGGNTMTVDPMVGSDTPPISASKLGLDCTIPLVGGFDPHSFDKSSICDLGKAPKQVTPMTVEELTNDMEAFIKAKPAAWKEILQKYQGQPYKVIYRAFSNLRHRLERANDAPWFRYTFKGETK